MRGRIVRNGRILESIDDIHAGAARLGPALRGLDALNVHRALAAMDATLDAAFEAKAAIEMALLDLQGRALGVPVHALLGGRLVDEVQLNAWIGAVPPEQAAREASDWLARGFSTAKIKVSGPGAVGIDRVAAVRAAVGRRMALRVDFNESLAPHEAPKPWRSTAAEGSKLGAHERREPRAYADGSSG